MMSEDYAMPPDPSEVEWRIEAEGRAWARGEATPRFQLTPEKTEMSDGKLYWSDADRLRMLGLLLENCGAEAAVRLGDPEIWRKAVAGLDDTQTNLRWAVRTALRRYADLSDSDAKGAVRFWLQTATTDFAHYNDPDKTQTPTATRNTLVSYWQGRSPADAAYDWDAIDFAVERVSFTNAAQTEAVVLVKQTTEQTRWETVSENERRARPKTTLRELWRDVWIKQEDGWRWSRRSCVERFEG